MDVLKLEINIAEYKITLKEGLVQDPLYQTEIYDHTLEELIKRKKDIEEHMIIIKEYTHGIWES